MKILIDENLPAKLKYDFGENHKALAVGDMGWLGKKNGELLGLAVFCMCLIALYGSMPKINKGTGGLLRPCLITL
jgi:hypothetical protein